MQPYDGVGYGISGYWDSLATNISKEKVEDCGHVLNVKLVSNSSKAHFIDVKIKCSICDNTYERTEKKILKQYLKFYGIKAENG